MQGAILVDGSKLVTDADLATLNSANELTAIIGVRLGLGDEHFQVTTDIDSRCRNVFLNSCQEIINSLFRTVHGTNSPPILGGSVNCRILQLLICSV